MADTKVEVDLDYRELKQCLEEVGRNFRGGGYGLDRLLERYHSFRKPGMGPAEGVEALVQSAAKLTFRGTPLREFTAARLWHYGFACGTEEQLEGLRIKGLYEKISYLMEQGLYGNYILRHYSREEIGEAEGSLNDGRNKLSTYAGLDLLLKWYVVQDYSHHPLETPQEMYLSISLHLATKESKDCRIQWARRFYNMLGRMQAIMVIPALSSAREPYHQLSSCFIGTMPGSLGGIYRSVDNFAQVSEFGGGVGLYLGKVRAAGSRIRGFKEVAGGMIRWTKLVNDTAVAMDQLGMRQGAAAVYLDTWHKDLPEFLQLRTSNGDGRMKAHNTFPAMYFPDLSWEMAEENLDQDWHLMYPCEIRIVKGHYLEDCYGELWEERYLDCVGDDRISKRTVLLKDVIHLIIKSAVETDTPLIFNRDTINRANPNSHRGVIYCSNLCIRITQNMPSIEGVSTQVLEVNEEIAMVQTTRSGDPAICSLASLCLGAIDMDDSGEVEYIAASAVRALNNVIDPNFYPLTCTGITSQNYRGIGLRASGYHRMLIKHGIRWESEEHLVFADQVFERIYYAAARASTNLAAEKGYYRYFKGNERQIGVYLEKRGLMNREWGELAEQMAEHGTCNAYLLAVASTSNTSILSGTTADLDPVVERFHLGGKKNATLSRVAPDLTPEIFWLYESGYTMDQIWAVRAAGMRRRHIDQTQSANLYITNDYTMWQLLNLYILAWESGIKIPYYMRNKSLEMEECESCSN